MTETEIKSTLSMMKGAICKVREKGNEVDSVRMGAKLFREMLSYMYNNNLPLHYVDNTSVHTIMGIPIEIDHVNPWVLKVMTAVDVPVMKESEVSGNNEKSI